MAGEKKKKRCGDVISRLTKSTPGLVFVGVFSIYLIAAFRAETPGRNDGLVYFHAAQNLVEGQGFTLPYIWNYLDAPQALPAPAFGYWMPLASFLCAGSMAILGQAVWAALLPNALMVAGLALMASWFCRQLGGSALWGTLAALIVAMNPLVIKYGTTTQAVLPGAVFGGGALLMVSRFLEPGVKRPKWMGLFTTGVLTGLACLSRGDGQLVLVVILTTLIWRIGKNREPKDLAKPILLVLAGWLLVLAPWGARNLSEFGTASPPGAVKALLVTEYEDIYSYDKALTVRDYFDAMADDPLGVISGKVATAGKIAARYLIMFGPLVLVAGLAVARSRRTPCSWYGMAAGHLVVCLLFYSLVGTEVGPKSALKASVVALPLLAGGGAVGISLLRGWHRVGIAVAMLGVMVWAAIPMVDVVGSRNKDYAWIGEAIQADQSIVVMSRKPWRVWEDAGLAAIQLPNDGLAAIVAAAEKFEATHLHLRFAEEREALSGIYGGMISDPRFELIATTGSHRLYSLHLKTVNLTDGIPDGQ